MFTFSDLSIILLNKPSLNYFGILYSGLNKKIISESEIPCVYTDGSTLFYSFDKNSSISLMLGLTIHCILHLISGHFVRICNRNVDLWNICCDHVVNREILNLCKSPLLHKNYLELPQNFVFFKNIDDKYPEISAEELYSLFFNLNEESEEKSNKALEFSQYRDSKNNPHIECKTRFENEKINKEYSCSQDVQYIKKTEIEKQDKKFNNVVDIGKVLWESETIDKGQVSNSMKRYLKKIFKIKVPWDFIVDLTIKEHSVYSDEPTWSKRNIYMPNLKIPGIIVDEKPLALVISLDLSGSISTEQAAKFASIISNASSYYDEIILLAHDETITGKFEFKDKSKDEILDFLVGNLTGGGGTSHLDVFNEIEKMWDESSSKIGLVLFFTDFISDIIEIFMNFKFFKYIPNVWIISRFMLLFWWRYFRSWNWKFKFYFYGIR